MMRRRSERLRSFILASVSQASNERYLTALAAANVTLPPCGGSCGGMSEREPSRTTRSRIEPFRRGARQTSGSH